LRSLVDSGFDSTTVTTIFTGRSLRHLATSHLVNWETNRQNEIKALQSQGIVQLEYELAKLYEEGILMEDIEDDCVLR
jgi:hypothetical protein